MFDCVGVRWFSASKIRCVAEVEGAPLFLVLFTMNGAALMQLHKRDFIHVRYETFHQESYVVDGVWTFAFMFIYIYRLFTCGSVGEKHVSTYGWKWFVNLIDINFVLCSKQFYSYNNGHYHKAAPLCLALCPFITSLSLCVSLSLFFFFKVSLLLCLSCLISLLSTSCYCDGL